ncbi:MAG TPA: DUF2079 domain-containing protein [Lacunisphaera sp.]|nr:DUF2079 domain-containing protein [Lacunisphaera sp.]
MLDALRNQAGELLTSPAPREPAALRRGEKLALAGAALVAGGWIFAFNLRRFLGLGTTSDLYVNLQLATSWLHGRFLHDEFFGNYLSVHGYFLNPLLALFAWPFGAPGLLLTIGLAAAAGLAAMAAILRTLGVPARVATVIAFVATLMPVSLQVYQVDQYGFQVELLTPALALWLASCLLNRNWPGTIILTLALQAMKEDALLVLLPVAGAIILEDALRPRGADGARSRWNRPAMVTIGLSVLVTPLLLALVRSQPSGDYTNLGSFAKVHAVDHAAINNLGTLVAYVAGNLRPWLGSHTVFQWLAAAMVGTFGLVLLRPHLLVLGILTTLTAWLVQGDLLWAPRFAPALAFLQLAGCLGFASAWSAGQARPGPVAFGRGAVIAGVLAAGMIGQFLFNPESSEVYRLAPALEISPAERAQADRLFAEYRRRGQAAEPVIVSDHLFRYVHDREFFWYARLRGRPRPVWILWDQQDRPLSVLRLYLRTDTSRDLSDYELVGQAGRFLLYRAWEGRPAAAPPQPVAISGAADGMIRLKVRFAAGRAGTTEPLLALGAPGRGELFFVHYLDEHRLVPGFDCLGLAVQTGGAIDYEAGKVYELDLFSGSLLAPAGGAPGKAQGHSGYEDFVHFGWNGREVLGTVAPAHLLGVGEIHPGYNFVRSGSAVARFSGELLEVRRGGYPPMTAAGTRHFGAVRLEVELPAAGTGEAEPLVVVGVQGEATLGYVRLLPDGKIKVGADFWSIGAFESEPVEVDRTKPVEITYSFPVFYPAPGDARWGGVAAGEQQRLRSRLQIRINGALAEDRAVAAPVPREPLLAIGRNPVGGSVVTERFSGRVLRVTRTPLESP